MVNVREAEKDLTGDSVDSLLQGVEEDLIANGLIGPAANGRLSQTGDNCFEIARFLAQRAGYDSPQSKSDMGSIIFRERARRLRWDNADSNPLASDAFMCIRTNDTLNAVHITFEYQGTEYNYGVTRRDGFELDMRIPLPKR
jgi:hypothetical protein